ncbi:hypothetical protein [Streptomyces sp. NPDC049555]|uniref:hypothetical protein n=1 Tax=Streptomyces sp. NPDC049555 TaxID=3154930 RepID=UPI003438215A
MTSRIAGAAALVTVTATALALAGCGGGDDTGKKNIDLQSAGSPTSGAGAAPTPAPTAVLGELKGPEGVVVTLTSAVRDKGGFLTVGGTVTNRGTKPYTPVAWRSKETEIKSQSSVSGASLVDPAGRKRYLVLRDTDGECLCTTGLVGIRPGESRAVYAQFPAPPAAVTEVDFQLPTMPSVRIRISG